MSLTSDGLAQVDHLSWESYHEGHDLLTQVENYKKRHGHYPEVVLADQIYGSRENRSYLKDQNIRFAGKALGRPKKVTDENRSQLRKEKRRRKAEYRERTPVEGKFGQGKNGYRLNYIRTRTQTTSEAWIRSIFLVMNLLVLADSFLRLSKTGLLNSSSFVKELFISFKLASGTLALSEAIYRSKVVLAPLFPQESNIQIIKLSFATANRQNVAVVGRVEPRPYAVEEMEEGGRGAVSL